MSADVVALTDWQLAEAPASSIAGPDGLDGSSLDWLPMEAPGTVAQALRDAGRWNEGDERDFDRDDWWFRTNFEAQPGAARLRFGGLATIADAWLNGEHVLHSDNMFVSHERTVMLAERNSLVIVCRSVTEHLRARRPRPKWKTRLIEQQQLRWVRTTFLGRMPSWTPTAAPVGPWRFVDVLASDAAGLRVAHLRASLDGAVGSLELVADVVGTPPEAAWLDVGGHRVQLVVQKGSTTHSVSGQLRIPDVDPWFPATHGRPALYGAEVIVARGAVETKYAIGSLGFRRIDVDETGGAWRISINDVPIFCRGAVWTPVDAVRLSADPLLLRDAVQQVAAAGCNMLRVPGIGVYEEPLFYDLCDELGVMVWHDAMFANVEHPVDDPEFRASVELELDQFLRSCQPHPSIVVVCGGSEVEQQAAMMGASPEVGRNRIGREVLPSAMARLLPDVALAPCSPHGGVFPFQPDHGVSHYYGVGAYMRPLSDSRTEGVRFTTECLAFANVPCRQAVDELLDGDGGPGHSPSWKRRVPRDRGAGWDFEDVRDHYVRTLLGADPLDIRYADADRYLDLGRAAASLAVEHTITEFRRSASSCDGALVFHLRDPWLAAGWGIIDVAGRPKSTYHALARASAPRTVLLSSEGLNGVIASVYNDRPSVLEGTLLFRLWDAQGHQLDESTRPVRLDGRAVLDVSVDGAFGHFRDLSYAYRFGPQQVDVIDATLIDAAGVELNRCHLLPAGHRRPRDPGLALRASAEVEEGALSIRVAADRFAHFVSIDIDNMIPSDNWFHLSPGEERMVRCTLRGDDAPRSGEIRALNGYGSRTVRMDGGPL